MNRIRFSPLNTRTGFSLIEVILATAILMGSVIVLARLAGMGREQAHKAALQTTAQQLCENKMNELLLALQPLEQVDNQPLLPEEFAQPGDLESLAGEDRLVGEPPLASMSELPGREENLEQESEWLYSVRVEPIDLLALFSTSREQNVDQQAENNGLLKLTVRVVQSDEELERPVQFSLTRWIRTSKMSSTSEFEPAFDLGSTGGFR